MAMAAVTSRDTSATLYSVVPVDFTGNDDQLLHQRQFAQRVSGGFYRKL